ncbi:MAG: D-2-hydroxyacid dehydrogenase [Oscillospiraceae bacterium]|nr:D-2-hydroxyacid dehydrogenase [Oscillospiraceae bacterium]
MNSAKIVMLEEKTVSLGDVSLDEFYGLGQVKSYPLTPAEKLCEYIGDADVAICNKSVFTREVMEKCPNLKYIGLCATGYNNIDIKAADDLGITVTNVPGYSSRAVAQQVFSYVLHFASRTADYSEDVRRGGWINSDTFSYFTIPTFELAGLTMGIVGMGSIGMITAEIAQAFGMRVIACTRTPKSIPGVEFLSKEEVFAQGDFISMHCPLTEETYKMVNASLLALCKKTAYFINTSRGDTVDEEALANALRSGAIAGAGIDVISCEPMKPDNPLRDAPNCLITPHVAWAPVQTRQRLIGIAAGNLRSYLNGTPVNVVNNVKAV